MLRIRPTSIGLSERDIDTHFHQINIYRNLRGEGYSKFQIQQFYDTQQKIKREQENIPEFEESSSMGTPEPPKLADSPPPSSPPRFRHSVRRSSLLRFAHNASVTSGSPEDASATDGDPARLSPSPISHAMTYRPRSRTYPWTESEPDDKGKTSGSTSYEYPVDQLASLTIERPPTPDILPKSANSIQFHAEAREFTPFALPSPMGSTISRASSQPEYQMEIPRIAPTLITRGPPITPPRRSSLANQQFPVSGNLSNTVASSVSLPAAVPVTPSPVEIRQPVHTEPRTYDAYGGRSRLPVYDDRLSPSCQPQTPADLARRPILTDRDTAYTAPPGIMGRRLHITGNDMSPATRGRELRSRWTREYQSAEVVERDRANEQRSVRMLWLDEWAADRVGEENS